MRRRRAREKRIQKMEENDDERQRQNMNRKIGKENKLKARIVKRH